MADRLIDLLRHGETLGGACFRGTRNDSLSATGWAQMNAVTSRDAVWTRVVSSPLRRCADFASALARQRGLPHAILPDLAERHFGAWEGLTADQIPSAELGRFWADPVGYTPAGAEPLMRFRERVLGAWQEVDDWAGEGTLVVTHGGVIRVWIAECLRMPPDAAVQIEVPHACLTRLRLPAPPGRPSLVWHGCR
ncbi:MAG: histidine phosphatase family protein [Opitutae bacterium]|nr:histidine phosphatase family protein [Opitutae bacterium]